tara:strand:- start:10361 stop:11437 length:1077 start_codon:yes stop_codon:yes gene_type:complete
MKRYELVLLPGDGIGPEIMKANEIVLKKISNLFGINISTKECPFGGNAIEKHNKPLPYSTLEECRNCDGILLAAVGDYKFDSLPREIRPESGLLKLRSELDLFANIRPIKIRESLINSSPIKEEIIKDIDLVVIRELTSGIYFGKPKGRIRTNEYIKAFNTMSYTDLEIERITNIAIKIANKRMNRICSVDKANVLDVSQLWREKVTEICEKKGNISLSHMYVDNASMQLIKDPKQFDVILTGNLFGDILSDEASILTGSIGMLPSASLGEKGPGLFEPVHGSAPDIAGSNKANPLAMILSTAMLFRDGLNEYEIAENIEKAVDSVLKSNYRTIDISEENKKILGCIEMGEKVAKNLE